MTETAHFDEAWKEALDAYFEPLLAFFFPQVHALVDWTRPIEFLDTNLQQLLPKSEVGKRIADKLVKVWQRSGNEAYILIHLEFQSYEDKDFQERMFVYHYRIFDFYRKVTLSLAILGDTNQKWRPDSYGYGLAGAEIRLKFPMVKLIDYEQRWPELEASPDLIAVLVMAHLRTKSTTGDPRSRKQWKWQLTRRLYEGGYQREDIVQLFRIIDWMMTLPPELKREFRQEILDYEEDQKMPLLSSIELMAREEGIKIGKAEGKKEIALNLLRQGFTSEQVAEMTEIPLETIQALQDSR